MRDRHEKHSHLSAVKPLIKLARVYKIPAETLDYLKQLWVDASKPGWWSIYGLAADYARYVGLETDAEPASDFARASSPILNWASRGRRAASSRRPPMREVRGRRRRRPSSGR